MFMNHELEPPQINHIPIASRKGMWTNEALEITMDVKRRTCSLRRAKMSWNSILSSLIYHLNRKNKVYEDGAKRCVYKRRGCCNDQVDLKYVRM
jgi:hypothetical protein